MPIYAFEDRIPTISRDAYIAPSAIVIGDVTVGADCYVGHGAILRGDYGSIAVGRGSAIEEGVIVHARPGDQTVIGERVTVGHGAMIHNANIGRGATIGMRAVISDFSEVGEGALVGEQALVRRNQKVPAAAIGIGVPVRVIGQVGEEQADMMVWAKEVYVDLAHRYPKGLREISRAEVATDPEPEPPQLDQEEQDLGQEEQDLATATRITILYDNETIVEGVRAGWGFSCLVERGGKKLLFDTGWDGDLLIANAERLGVDLGSVDTVFISHRHWDHMGGLARVLTVMDRPRVFAPASLSSKLKAEIAQRAVLVEVSGEVSVAAGLTSTGELGEETKEQSLVIVVPGGLAVLTGCAHPGLKNILAWARKRGEPKVVIGGFHGFAEIDELAALEQVVPGHCTVHREAILERFADKTRRCGVGMVLEL